MKKALRKGRTKQPVFDWPDYNNSPAHVKNWFRTLGSKKLKGAAREQKLRRAMDAVTHG